jgi:hypothetical protein
VSNSYDIINGTFELVGAVATFGYVRSLIRDRVVRGVDYRSMAFFASWGIWNLIYYPHLDQWVSTVGGAALVAGNIAWLLLRLYYSRRAT